MKEQVFDQPGTLQLVTVKLIKESPLTLPELYKESGVPFYWLRKFVNNEFKNPSVNRIQYLYQYLSGKKLVL